MQFKKFQEVLKEKYPTSSAYIPNVYGTENKKVAIEVTFSEGQKSYTYTGSIFSIAERLNLIPEVDIMKESEKIAELLKTQSEVIGPKGCADTISYLMDKSIDWQEVGKDEFDRPTNKYFFMKESAWV